MAVSTTDVVGGYESMRRDDSDSMVDGESWHSARGSCSHAPRIGFRICDTVRRTD